MQAVPYRSSQKLSKLNIIVDEPPTIPKIRPSEVRKTTLHHIHSNKTWMVDYFFLRPGGDVISSINRDEALESLPEAPSESVFVNYRGKPMMIVCCFIHCNSRFVWCYVARSKRAGEFAAALDHLVKKYPERVGTLISDKESAFSSRVANELYAAHNIRHIYYNMSDSTGNRVNHLALAFIDRFARTLRDMIFNCSRSDPRFRLNEKTLERIIKIYNATPHATLSKVMGFDVAPYDAFKPANEGLLNEINRRIFMQNYMTTQRIEFRSIQEGDQVYLHKPRRFGEKRRLNVEDEPYTVYKCKRGGFELKDAEGNILQETIYDGTLPIRRSRIVPRSEITVPK